MTTPGDSRAARVAVRTWAGYRSNRLTLVERRTA
jgi:hypothetical protein